MYNVRCHALCVSDIFVKVVRCNEPLWDDVHRRTWHLPSCDWRRLRLFQSEAQPRWHRVTDGCGMDFVSWTELVEFLGLSPNIFHRHCYTILHQCEISVLFVCQLLAIIICVNHLCVSGQESAVLANCCHSWNSRLLRIVSSFHRYLTNRFRAWKFAILMLLTFIPIWML